MKIAFITGGVTFLIMALIFMGDNIRAGICLTIAAVLIIGAAIIIKIEDIQK